MQNHPRLPMRLLLPLVAPCQPRFHLRMLVRALVVDYEVQGLIGRRLGIELLEEREPLPVGLLARNRAEDFPVHIGKCRQERDRAVTLVSRRARTGMASAQR